MFFDDHFPSRRKSEKKTVAEHTCIEMANSICTVLEYTDRWARVHGDIVGYGYGG